MPFQRRAGELELTRRSVILPRPVVAAASLVSVSLVRYRQQAMATTWEITLPDLNPAAMGDVDCAFDVLHGLESLMTVYRDESKVSALNRLQPGIEINLETSLFGLLARCCEWWHQTDGALDIASGRMIKAWGFFRGPPCVPDQSVIEALPGLNGMDKVRLDPAKRTFEWLSAGVELNLGCVGKGFAVDAMNSVLESERGLVSGLIQGGGSSARGWGVCPGESNGWRVSIKHPWLEGAVIAEAILENMSLGTSAGSFRHLQHAGKRLPHILNPRTCRPAEGMASVSVLAPDAALADALSTAFFIMGPEKASSRLGQWPGVTALFVADTGKITVMGEQPGRFHVCCH
jgi:thiamine biosynthesis lipoprotein